MAGDKIEACGPPSAIDLKMKVFPESNGDSIFSKRSSSQNAKQSVFLNDGSLPSIARQMITAMLAFIYVCNVRPSYKWI